MILKTNCRKILFLLLISPVTFAAAKEHRHHEAHVHGSATLNIAFEKLQGKIEFKAAADSILGFEHEAKSEKDKKTVSDISSLFENNINTMVHSTTSWTKTRRKFSYGWPKESISSF